MNAVIDQLKSQYNMLAQRVTGTLTAAAQLPQIGYQEVREGKSWKGAKVAPYGAMAALAFFTAPSFAKPYVAQGNDLFIPEALIYGAGMILGGDLMHKFKKSASRLDAPVLSRASFYGAALGTYLALMPMADEIESAIERDIQAALPPAELALKITELKKEAIVWGWEKACPQVAEAVNESAQGFAPVVCE